METLKILTYGLDNLQRGLAILETAGYDTSDIQDGVNHLVADIKESQIALIDRITKGPATEWIESDHVMALLEKYRQERDNESVFASGREL